GRVGAVFAIEASRLARNGRDWHTLIEFCGLVGTIIVDEDGLYDPRHPNDRLLLGMKGTMSELELSLFRQRSHEALKQKARRGALFSLSRPAMRGSGMTGSRWIRISGYRTPSGWSSPSSPSCKACDRCTCGCRTRALRCPSHATRRRRGAASSGGCRSTTRSTTS